MADVNGLKLINDSFGHAVGDQLLVKATEVINKGCRADDMVARLGGDEFVVLLPRTDKIQAEEIIARIKEFAKEESIYGTALSISFGYGIKYTEFESILDAFKEAEDYMYKHKLYESAGIHKNTVNLIMNTLYAKNEREMNHSKRVAKLCEEIARQMGYEENHVKEIRLAGLMHDIGKIGIDEQILNKSLRLDDNENHQIRRHSEIGYRILTSVNEFAQIAKYVLEHHEMLDGSGYPRGLKGEEIAKKKSRIITVADAFDAMTHRRSYGRVISEQEAADEIKKKNVNKQFDEKIAKTLIVNVLGLKW